MQYVEHPEHKFDGDVWVLERKHVHTDGFVYIGKEANKVEIRELESNQVEMYHDIEKLRDYFLNLTPAEAREVGIMYRSTLKKLKDGVRKGASR